MPPTPIRWLTASNVLWLLAGVVAYMTSISLVVGTAIALVPALPGLMEAKRATRDPQRLAWLDRAFSFAIAGWAIMAVMIIIPYIASEDGISLWTSRSFAGLGIAAASISMLLWNGAAFQALAEGDEIRSVRLYAAFHAVLLVVALVFFTQSDMGTATFILRGQEITMPDPKMTAGIAAAPGLLWALVMWRGRIEPSA